MAGSFQLELRRLEICCNDFGSKFADTVLTTNFDPLIELGIRKAGGQYFRTALTTDGNLAAGAGTVPHITYLHGYWYGTETLHTPAQLDTTTPFVGEVATHSAAR